MGVTGEGVKDEMRENNGNDMLQGQRGRVTSFLYGNYGNFVILDV